MTDARDPGAWAKVSRIPAFLLANQSSTGNGGKHLVPRALASGIGELKSLHRVSSTTEQKETSCGGGDLVAKTSRSIRVRY